VITTKHHFDITAQLETLRHPTEPDWLESFNHHFPKHPKDEEARKAVEAGTNRQQVARPRRGE